MPSRALTVIGTGGTHPAATLSLSVDRGADSSYPTGGPMVITYSASTNDTLTLRVQRSDGTRTLFFELNGQPREVTVRDRALRVVERTHPKADPADSGQVGAPTAGLVSGIAVRRAGDY